VARALALALLGWAGIAAAVTVPDRPAGRLNDYAGALAPDAHERLERQLASVSRGTRQVVVVLLPSLEGEPIEDLSMRFAEKWRIGGRKSDDGVLITLALTERRSRMEVGYGLEERLPDAVCARILDGIAPLLARGDLEGALRQAIGAVGQSIGEGHRAEPALRDLWPELLGVLALIAFLVVFRRHPFTALLLGGFLSGGRRRSGGSFGGGGGSFGGGGASGKW
jgi:uncharacterized protein